MCPECSKRSFSEELFTQPEFSNIGLQYKLNETLSLGFPVFTLYHVPFVVKSQLGLFHVRKCLTSLGKLSLWEIHPIFQEGDILTCVTFQCILVEIFSGNLYQASRNQNQSRYGVQMFHYHTENSDLSTNLHLIVSSSNWI